MIEILINTFIGVFFLLVTYSIVRKMIRSQEHIYKRLADALEQILDFAVNGVKPLHFLDLPPSEPFKDAYLVSDSDKKAEQAEGVDETEESDEKDPTEIIDMEYLRGITFSRKYESLTRTFPVLKNGFPVAVTLPQELVIALDKYFGYEDGYGDVLISMEELKTILNYYDIKFMDEEAQMKFEKNNYVDKLNFAASIRDKEKEKLESIIQKQKKFSLGLKFEDGVLKEVPVEIKTNSENTIFDSPPVIDAFAKDEYFVNNKMVLRFRKDDKVVSKLTKNESLYERYQLDWGIDIDNKFFENENSYLPTEEQFKQWLEDFLNKKKEEDSILYDE